MLNKEWSSLLNTPPPTPFHRLYTGDPEVFAIVSEDSTNMANGDVYVRLPEFLGARRCGVVRARGGALCLPSGLRRRPEVFSRVAALGSSTSTRLVGFIADPPHQYKYEAIKAHLLKTFSLSAKERARQIFDIQGLGDSKPSQLMEKMQNLLGGEDPRILFVETFLRHLPPRVQTALANTTITDPRALAEEADRFFLATQQPGADVLAATLRPPLRVGGHGGSRPLRLQAAAGTRGSVFTMHGSGLRRRSASPPAATSHRETREPALGSGPERWRHKQASLR